MAQHVPTVFALGLRFHHNTAHVAIPANETSIGIVCDQRPWRHPRSSEARLTPMKASSAP